MRSRGPEAGLVPLEKALQSLSFPLTGGKKLSPGTWVLSNRICQHLIVENGFLVLRRCPVYAFYLQKPQQQSLISILEHSPLWTGNRGKIPCFLAFQTLPDFTNNPDLIFWSHIYVFKLDCMSFSWNCHAFLAAPFLSFFPPFLALSAKDWAALLGRALCYGFPSSARSARLSGMSPVLPALDQQVADTELEKKRLNWISKLKYNDTVLGHGKSSCSLSSQFPA